MPNVAPLNVSWRIRKINFAFGSRVAFMKCNHSSFLRIVMYRPHTTLAGTE